MSIRQPEIHINPPPQGHYIHQNHPAPTSLPSNTSNNHLFPGRPIKYGYGPTQHQQLPQQTHNPSIRPTVYPTISHVGGQHVTVVDGNRPLKPSPQSRVEYVPYDTYYTDYETQQVLTSTWVPVQRKCLNYYTVEHITDFIPRQITEMRMEVVPEERTHWRTQYVPVERQVVHYPKDDEFSGLLPANQRGHINQGAYALAGGNLINGPRYGGQVHARELNIPGYQAYGSVSSSRQRTNYVTSDNYTPEFLVRENHFKEPETNVNSFPYDESPSKRLREDYHNDY